MNRALKIESLVPRGFQSCELVEGVSLCALPLWEYDNVNAGEPGETKEYDKHLANTVGTSYVGGDELRFDERTGILRSLRLAVPDAHASDVTAWAFTSGELLAVNEPVQSGRGTARLVKVFVTEHLAFLFSDECYVGWLLRAPILCTAAGAARVDASATPQPSTGALFEEYMGLVSSESLRTLSRPHDPTRHALVALRDKAVKASCDAPYALELASQIDDLLGRFAR
ncbi:MAG: hypothetical protein U0271_15575 [Polyangiaceae bacterium]